MTAIKGPTQFTGTPARPDAWSQGSGGPRLLSLELNSPPGGGRSAGRLQWLREASRQVPREEKTRKTGLWCLCCARLPAHRQLGRSPLFWEGTQGSGKGDQGAWRSPREPIAGFWRVASRTMSHSLLFHLVFRPLLVSFGDLRGKSQVSLLESPRNFGV